MSEKTLIARALPKVVLHDHLDGSLRPATLLELLAERGADDILVVGGGVIPDADVAALTAQGVKALILQDTPPDAIVAAVRRVVAERGAR